MVTGKVIVLEPPEPLKLNTMFELTFPPTVDSVSCPVNVAGLPAMGSGGRLHPDSVPILVIVKSPVYCGSIGKTDQHTLLPVITLVERLAVPFPVEDWLWLQTA